MLLTKLLPLILFLSVCCAQTNVEWNVVSVKTLAALGAVIPPGATDHINVFVRAGGRKTVAVEVTVEWDGAPALKKLGPVSDIRGGRAAAVTIDIPTTATRPVPTRITVLELRGEGKATEVKP